MIKRRTLQVSSLKHSIKKDMFFCLGQIEIILVGQGGSPPPSPSWLRACNCAMSITINRVIIKIPQQ